jgi:hypothetical protein
MNYYKRERLQSRTDRRGSLQNAPRRALRIKMLAHRTAESDIHVRRPSLASQ